jgi:hypothetical protein
LKPEVKATDENINNKKAFDVGAQLQVVSKQGEEKFEPLPIAHGRHNRSEFNDF